MERPDADRSQRLSKLDCRRETAGDAAAAHRTGMRHAGSRQAPALLLRDRAARYAQRPQGCANGEGCVERPVAGRAPRLHRLDRRRGRTRRAHAAHRPSLHPSCGRETPAADDTCRKKQQCAPVIRSADGARPRRWLRGHSARCGLPASSRAIPRPSREGAGSLCRVCSRSRRRWTRDPAPHR